MPDKIYIYGDSLLKATVPDVDFHYHFHINEVMQRYQTKLVEVCLLYTSPSPRD